VTITETTTTAIPRDSAAKTWSRALERTAAIARHPERIFPGVVDDLAARMGDAPALLSDGESLCYRSLAERANRYARWALSQGLAKGDTVCLLMPNRPEYLAVWLGITKIGGVVALLNTNLTGSSLAHCINLVDAKHVIVAVEFVNQFTTATPYLSSAVTTWVHGSTDHPFSLLEPEVEQHSGEPLADHERRQVTIEDRALYIYTSGTTGLPKAANVSHARIMQWSHWFAGMMNVQPSDRMYNCLPMYHSVGGVVAMGAMLAGGGSVVLREKFSASQFWSDVNRWGCTLFQYIGELCRYLLHAEPSDEARGHRIRMACGNGLRPDVWDEFKHRFRIPHIFEFYASTEGGVSLFNIEGESGAIGRVPGYLTHRASPALVRFDVETGEPLRDEQGFCIPCASNEAGEAIGPLLNHASNIGSRFEGYTSAEASEKKILSNVFKPGDSWVRTGDLMRKDERGFFYFVDRIGDTFRWKGENVSTSEVSEAIGSFPGVKEATVYGVAIPASDGRAGMVTLVAEDGLDLAALRVHLSQRLPNYARPLFLRIRGHIEITGTFKHTKADLIREGYNPTEIPDALYFNHSEQHAFVSLDTTLYDRIQSGQIRL
jgi:fatty-acyl-CoA synthase